MKVKYLPIITALVALVILFAAWDVNQQRPEGVLAADAQQPTRQGAWLDSMVFTEQGDPNQAIVQLQADELDLYAYSLADATLLQTVLEDPNLTQTEAFATYFELTFNPSGPTFLDGRLNPFSNAKIRQAMNWLVDRDKIAQEIMGGLAVPKYLPLAPSDADFSRFKSTVDPLETQYEYNFSLAQSTITTEMEGMGASLMDGAWSYNGEPVSLKFIIRVEDYRRPTGDYVADQLEAIGFTIDRMYLTREEASPIWNLSDPAEGQWHIYTGGWVSTAIYRDVATNFGFFYTPLGGFSPLWQAYNPTPEFQAICDQLWTNDFSSLEERGALFEQALGMAMNDSGEGTTGSGSLHVWLVDTVYFNPRRSGTMVASDLVGGTTSADLFPYIARFEGVEGGDMRIAQPGLLVDPWNPVAGSNWVYDNFPMRMTTDQATLSDPNTGLEWAQRLEKADCVVKEGTPITKTLDWVSLTYSPVITIPLDAWVDWDATSQTFISAGEVATPTLVANSKCTVTYPVDLFSTVTWHDGSPLSMGDFLMRMILQFDRAKPLSEIYDEFYVGTFQAFMSHFRGVKIESIDPLVITTYDDMTNYLDVELLASQETWWPSYGYLGENPGAWHNLTPAIRGEVDREIAFSNDKANQLGIEWTNFIAGASLPVLESWMNISAGENYIPYAPTMGQFVSAEEATARWSTLQAWYAARQHFWLGTGPFYVDQISFEPKQLILTHFETFVDASGRWDTFAAPSVPVLELNHSSGAPGSYFNLSGTGFPADSEVFIMANNAIVSSMQVDSSGAISFTLGTIQAKPGDYHLRLTANPSAGVLMTLDMGQPTWPREGELPVIFLVQPLTIHIPIINKN